MPMQQSNQNMEKNNDLTEIITQGILFYRIFHLFRAENRLQSLGAGSRGNGGITYDTR